MKPCVVVASTARLPNPWAHSHATAQLARALGRVGARSELWHRAPRDETSGVPDYYGMNGAFAVRAVGSIGPGRLGSALAAIRLARAAARDRPDLCFTRTPLVAVLAAWGDVAVVYEEHRVPSLPERLLLRAAARRAAFRAALGRTPALRDSLARRGVPQAKVGMLPSGVDLERFSGLPERAEARRRLGLPEAAWFVGYVGRLRKDGEKGVADLVRALEHLPEDVVLLCVGGPSEAERDYRSLACDLGVEARVRFVARTHPRDVPLWIRACDVATVPLPAGRTHESSLKLFEYMATEVPVVASRVPANEVVLTHERNALLVEPGSPEELAAAVGRLLDDAVLAGRLAARAREDVVEHTWERRAEEILRHAGLAVPA